MHGAMLQLAGNCVAIAPELTLIAALVFVVMVDLAFLTPRSTGAVAWIALAGLIAAFTMLMRFEPQPDPTAFSGAIRLDSFALFFQKLFVLGAMAICLSSTASFEMEGRRLGEYYALILSATLGAMFLAAANDFVMLVLSLETLSLSSYVLAGYLRGDRQSAEASLKYVLFGAVASGIMLFGLSYLYGMTGTLKLAGALAPLRQSPASLTFLTAWILVLAGIGFKISAVPFHNWTPDVYEGSPTPITAFLAVVSKPAGFAILLRLVLQAGAAGPGFDLAVVVGRLAAARMDILFWVLAAATMTVGNLAAIRQTDIKRLLGYSSIAQAGYILMAFTVMNAGASQAVLFYLVVYCLMTVGAFYVAIVLKSETGSAEMSACRGMWVASPYLVVAMTIFLVSLTGLPPTAGFPGKLKLFKVLIDASLGQGLRGPWFYLSLALIGAVNSVISLYYYFKIVRAMVLEGYETLPTIRLSLLDLGALGALMAAVIFFGLYFDPVQRFVQTAFLSLGGLALVGGP